MTRPDVNWLQRRYQDHRQHNPDLRHPPAISRRAWRPIVGLAVVYALAMAAIVFWPW